MRLPELETKCWMCWGSGKIASEDHGGGMECPECGGVGWLPTADGRRLLDFVQRHLGIVEEGEDNETL
ncbi:hypothetical protein [Syntrophobacter fumaroxidans]|nr:hypothetical protein [Syntrophobacter fumaroxidans]